MLRYVCLVLYLATSQSAEGAENMDSLMKRVKEKSWTWGLNTSNEGKKTDFFDLLRSHDLTLSVYTNYDLDEIDADPIDVVVHKASQMAEDGIIVEDTSFEVDGADIGVNIRWRLHELKNYRGHRAILRTLIGFRLDETIVVFEGRVDGKIVAPRGPTCKGFEINPYFLPDGQNETLAENPSSVVNPRAIAVANLAKGNFLTIRPRMTQWLGQWQANGN